MTRTARLLIAATIALLSGCQSWTTVEFLVPASRADEVRASIDEVSASIGLQPCSHWRLQVKGADACFGGPLDGQRVTVAGGRREQSYSVRIGVHASGRYDAAAFQAIEDRYRAALLRVVPAEDLVRGAHAAPIELSGE